MASIVKRGNSYAVVYNTLVYGKKKQKRDDPKENGGYELIFGYRRKHTYKLNVNYQRETRTLWKVTLSCHKALYLFDFNKTMYNHAFFILSIIDTTLSFSIPDEKDKEYELSPIIQIARLINDLLPSNVTSVSSTFTISDSS